MHYFIRKFLINGKIETVILQEVTYQFDSRILVITKEMFQQSDLRKGEYYGKTWEGCSFIL